MKKEIEELLDGYDDMFTVCELQKFLKLGRTKTYQLLQEKKIISVKNGTDYRIPKTAVKSYIYDNLT